MRQGLTAEIGRAWARTSPAWLAVFFIGAAVAACSGDGAATTPAKIVNYTHNNVKRSVREAPATARGAGKRITRAVGSDVSDEDAPGTPKSKPEKK